MSVQELITELQNNFNVSDKVFIAGYKELDTEIFDTNNFSIDGDSCLGYVTLSVEL